MENFLYEALETKNLLDLKKTVARELFLKFKFPWEVLEYLKSFILKLGQEKYDNNEKFVKMNQNIWIAKSAKLDENIYLSGPLIIEENSAIRYGAYIRGNVIIDKNCVVGHSSEIKNTIFFENVQVPHFNYVGDSILGTGVHIGAGVILSNLRSDKNIVKINYKDTKINTNLRKFGAVLGDGVEVGCNAVLNPGTILGKNTSVYPTSMVRGFVGNNKIIKNDQKIIDKFSAY